MKITRNKIKEFLLESNAIEGIYDNDSLNQALIAWDYLMTQKEITLGVICETHRFLMKNHNLKDNEKGYFRKIPIYIGGRMGIDADEIEHDLHHLIMNINDVVSEGKYQSPIWKKRICKEHHIYYEKIHPFIDGNGRTGRMFMNWERLQIDLPLLIIHEGKEQMGYYDWFK
mgnify:FL=1